MNILIQHQRYLRGKFVPWSKKILLGLIILAGLIGMLKSYGGPGLFDALGLFITLLSSTTFLWQWASGKLPGITKLHAILILLASTVASVFAINMTVVGDLHVDLMEVIHVTIAHSPLFYLILCMAAWVKVGIWQRLFNGAQMKEGQPV